MKNIGSVKEDLALEKRISITPEIVKKFKNLNVNYTSQKKFLTNLGIFHRAEIIGNNKTFSEKADIFYRLKRLTDENEMGKLFKVMLIKNTNINSKIGF